MATLEIEGPDSGWVATVGFEAGELRVLDTREGGRTAIQQLFGRLLLEPAPSGRVPGAYVVPDDEDVLYEMADALRRRKPECRGERLVGYVSGGSRYVEAMDYAEEG
jgi:hypothetical protein